MQKRICRECSTEMVKQYTPEGLTFFCETCAAATTYDEVAMEPYCPECGEKITVCAKCCVGYFCNKCNSLKSSKKVIWKKI